MSAEIPPSRTAGAYASGEVGQVAASAVADQIPVLLYHSVDDDPPRGIARHTVSRDLFSAHIDTVSESGRTPLLVSELASALRGERALPERPVAITFDDGFADTYRAVETLIERDLPATVYVTTGEVGARDRLSPAQLAELGEHPAVELGAHSVRHVRLDELDARELEEQVRGSRGQLEQLAEVAVRSFAYPHGAHDRRTRDAVVSAGYSSAAAVKNALSHPRDDPLAIARWTVTAGTPASRIEQVLEGQGVPRSWPGERARTRAYRAVRRRRRRFTRAVSRLRHRDGG